MPTFSPAVTRSSVTLFVGFIASLVGIFTPRWTDYNGLFQACSEGCISIDLSLMPSYFKATVAMEILAFLASLVCFGCLVAYLALEYKGSTSSALDHLPRMVYSFSYATGFFSLIGCIVFGALAFSSDVLPNYSYFLTLFGGLDLMTGGFLFYKSTIIMKVGAAAQLPGQNTVA